MQAGHIIPRTGLIGNTGLYWEGGGGHHVGEGAWGSGLTAEILLASQVRGLQQGSMTCR